MIGSIEDFRLACERALETPNGVRTDAGSPGGAVHLRQRLYKFRKAEQKSSTKIYPPGHPAHGTSPYDGLVFQIVPEEPSFVRIVRPRELVIEDL